MGWHCANSNWTGKHIFHINILIILRCYKWNVHCNKNVISSNQYRVSLISVKMEWKWKKIFTKPTLAWNAMIITLLMLLKRGRNVFQVRITATNTYPITEIKSLSLTIKINEILMSSLFSCDLRKTCSNASYRRKSSSYAAGYHLWGLFSWFQEQKTTLMSKSEDIQKRFDLGYWKKWKSCSHLLVSTNNN